MSVAAMKDQPSTWPEVLDYMRMKYTYAPSDWRMGQAYFNALYEIYPEIADMVRATDADPFQANKPNDPRMVKFIDTIMPYFI